MTTKKSNLKFIFVHGLSGWGSYDKRDKFFPYWGMSGGSIIKYLRKLGYDCYSASVAPTGSAWDRACELYAQLAGKVVDYGREHSERCKHSRYGRDFSKEPLIEDFENSRIVLLGHSFGGATVRLFAEILANGWQTEKDASPEEISDFFVGGKEDRIFALVTLAAPTNGTTAYDMYLDESFDIAGIEVPRKYERTGSMVSMGTKPVVDGRVSYDYASYDMHIDHALRLNELISTLKDTYYFAYPCSSCESVNGVLVPNSKITEGMFMRSAILMSKYVGKTKGGFVVDASWNSNDGLVNEISAKAPLNAPSKKYDPNTTLATGIWYVMDTFKGDHMSLQGGLTKRVNIKPFYKKLVEMISQLQ